MNLLKARENFDKGILNSIAEDSLEENKVIMLQVEYTKYFSKLDSNRYYVTLYKLNIDEFKYFTLPRGKYFGYFNYNKHTILVYGDENVGYFFTKTTIKKKFAFFSLKKTC